MEKDPAAKIMEQAEKIIEPNPAAQFMEQGFV